MVIVGTSTLISAAWLHTHTYIYIYIIYIRKFDYIITYVLYFNVDLIFLFVPYLQLPKATASILHWFPAVWQAMIPWRKC